MVRIGAAKFKAVVATLTAPHKMAEAASGSDSAQGGEASPRDSETSDGSFEDWKSSAEDMEPCKCLFCEFVSVPSTIITHCTTEHGFDIMTILRARGLKRGRCHLPVR